jgi:hypothetical protein
VTSHTALQSQIITLQSVLVTTFLYGPTSTEPISHQLSNIYAASRAAATASVEILAALEDRLQDERPLTPRSMHSHTPSLAPSHSISQAPSNHITSHAPLHHTSHVPTHATYNTPTHSRSRARSQTISHAPTYESHHTPSHLTSHVPSRALTLAPGTSSTSTALMKYQELPRPSHVRSSSPVNTTILEWRDKTKPGRTETDVTSTTEPASTGIHSASDDLYCSYAIDLQRSPTQLLSPSIVAQTSPHCPHCKGGLHLSPGKAWEISKWDDDCERTFQVQNRFVVKCRKNSNVRTACKIYTDFIHQHLRS